MSIHNLAHNDPSAPAHAPTDAPVATPLDARLDAMLDAALAVVPPAGLADRIVAATESRLASPRRAVLGRIGGPLMGLAAMLVLAVGAAAWVAALDAGSGGDAGFDPIASRLAELDAIDAARDADIDEQITLLALQIDLAEREDWWAPADERLDRAALQYQLDALSTDPAIF